VGDSGVGKTSILLRFTTEEFKDDQKSTIGVDLKLKLLQMNGKNLKLTIWDTAGKNSFNFLNFKIFQ
jgi:Ras-related protein Rab-18